MNKKCQIFTPENYVEELLNSIDYKNSLYGKKILENSCGDGNILTCIVKRYIKDCRKKEYSTLEIKNGLERDIYGVEIDPIQFTKCIENLNDIANKENINNIRWNVYNSDYLKSSISIKFDYIVGNPPYITYKELDRIQREFLKDNFLSCKNGKFDYCYAFIEKSINSLSEQGKLSYLIPSSIFKTVFGKNLRSFMLTYVSEIRDYTTEILFDNALVKSAIIVLKKNNEKKSFLYKDISNKIKRKVSHTSLQEKWFFTNYKNLGNRKFGDFFKVSHVVATLLNEAYVLKNWENDREFIIVNNCRIERSILRRTATPRTLKSGKEELILFPYGYNEDGLTKYSVDDFETLFPYATKYLKNYSIKLDKRKKDSNCKWFEYGRSQAISELNREKLLVSTVVTERVNVYMLNEDYIPYSGMFIVPKTHIYNLDDARDILQSADFLQFVTDVGIHISGNSLRITSKDIMDYKFWGE